MFKKWKSGCYLVHGESWNKQQHKDGGMGHTIWKGIVVTDGSFKDQHEASAHIIKGEDLNHRIVGVNIVPGPLENHNS